MARDAASVSSRLFPGRAILLWWFLIGAALVGLSAALWAWALRLLAGMELRILGSLRRLLSLHKFVNRLSDEVGPLDSIGVAEALEPGKKVAADAYGELLSIRFLRLCHFGDHAGRSYTKVSNYACKPICIDLLTMRNEVKTHTRGSSVSREMDAPQAITMRCNMHTRKECEAFIWWLSGLPQARQFMPAGAMSIIDRWVQDDGPESLSLSQLRSVVKSFDELGESARNQLTEGYRVDPDFFNLEELRLLNDGEDIQPVLLIEPVRTREDFTQACAVNTTILRSDGDDKKIRLEIRAGTPRAQVIASLQAMLNAVKFGWADCLAAGCGGSHVAVKPWHADPIPWPVDECEETKKPSPLIESSELETEDEIEVGLATAA
jgi:hypothetical protein